MGIDVKAKLIQLEKHLFKAEVRTSAEQLQALIADEFTEIGASGVRFGKAEVLERLPLERPPLIEAFDFEHRYLSETCVQLFYKAKMIKNGDVKAKYSLRCSIWQLTGKHWQMIYHQGTGCEPFESNRKHN